MLFLLTLFSNSKISLNVFINISDNKIIININSISILKNNRTTGNKTIIIIEIVSKKLDIK